MRSLARARIGSAAESGCAQIGSDAAVAIVGGVFCDVAATVIIGEDNGSVGCGREVAAGW